MKYIKGIASRNCTLLGHQWTSVRKLRLKNRSFNSWEDTFVVFKDSKDITSRLSSACAFFGAVVVFLTSFIKIKYNFISN